MDKKIISTGFPKDEEFLIGNVSITYYQNPDCTEDSDSPYQELVISTRDNGTDRFINIQTDNWSIDGIEDLKFLIEDFSKRAEL